MLQRWSSAPKTMIGLKGRVRDLNTSHPVLRTWFNVFTMATGLTSFSISHLLFLLATVLQ